MYRLCAALLFFGALLPGTSSTHPISTYASLHNDLEFPSAEMLDTDSEDAQYTIDIAQGTCSDDPADLEPFTSTRLAFQIQNDHYLPVHVVKVKLKIRNIVTKELRIVKVKPFSYAEIAANELGTVQVLLSTISDGVKYYIGTTDPIEAGFYNIKAVITIRSSTGEKTTLTVGLALGASDINRC